MTSGFFIFGVIFLTFLSRLSSKQLVTEYSLRCFRAKLRRKGPRRTFEQQEVNGLVKAVQCLRTNLYAHYHPDIIDELRYVTHASYHHRGQRRTFFPGDPKINSLDDCIDGIKEPLYGFRVRVKLVEDEPCVLGQTCEEQSEIHSLHAQARTSEKFFAEGYPHCHARFDPYLSNC